MNLNYRVLWVDDDESFIESQSQTLEKLTLHIENEGFDIEFVFKASPEDLDLSVIGDEFDLIVIDYNLTEHGENGDDVIKAVRENNFLTEVIFYSGNSSGILRKIAADKQLDGVFFSTKDADALFAKVVSVFELTIRKVVDINNMRGIVMAAIADIDHQLSDLLQSLHDGLNDEKKNAHRKKLFGKMLPTVSNIRKLASDESHDILLALEKAIDAVRELEPKEFTTLVENRGFDSHKRVEAIESFCKIEGPLLPFKEKIETIKLLLQWRNALAHQRPVLQNGIAHFLLGPDELHAFNAENGRVLRKSIREHRITLRNAKLAVLAK